MPSRRHKRGRWSAPASTATAAESEAVRRQAAGLFERRFQFDCPADGWRLPDEPDLFPEELWQVDELQLMKQELNAVKSKLSDKDIIAWHEHTCATSRAGLVVSSVKRQIRPEIGTQAWCKFYELLSLWSVLPEDCAAGAAGLRSLHLCEAPGAFITALNHYCVLNGVQEWEWCASTLNPYYEGNPLSRMISDDRFILHTLERWQFGADDTGDLMTPTNAERLLAAAGPGVNLVTADGSVDCQGQPAEQECIVSDLHLCEVYCALRALRPGGTLVIKMFTLFEASSVCLLYLLNCCFDQVTVVKPSCSKAGNSEVYVVCRRRAAGRPSAALLAAWWRQYGPQARSRPLLARRHVPDSFMEQLVRCAGFFKSLQEAEIGRNLRLFVPASGPGGDPGIWEETEAVRRAAVAEYLDRCRLAPIDKHLRLTHPLNTRLFTSFQMENKSGSGTYEQRTGRRSATERLRSVVEELAALPPPPVVADELWWRPATPAADPLDPASRTDGLPPDRLRASKFCCLHQLRLHGRTVEAVSELAPDLLTDASPAAEVLRTDGGVQLSLPWRADCWPCDAATVTALRRAAGLLRPGETLEVTGLYLLHRLNISLLQLMAARSAAAAAVLVVPAAGAPPLPRLQLRTVADPAALDRLLESVQPLVTGRCLSLLPLTEICQRPAAEQLTAYNSRLLRAITEHLVRAAGTESAPLGQTEL